MQSFTHLKFSFFLFQAELKIEAIAMCRLGNVYANILKMNDRARECYTRSVKLALMLNSQTYFSEGVVP